jgi:hypothetical protein
MSLAQRCFLWVVVVAVLAMAGGLLLAGVELGRINRNARGEEVSILLSEILLRVDRRAVNIDGLAFIAKRNFTKLPRDTTVALVNSDGEIVVSSLLGREGTQAPEDWMGPDHSLRTDRWSHWFRGTLTMGSAVMDREGRQMATLTIEHTVPAVPVIATILLAALRWGGLVLVAFLPACWFASRLITRPLCDTAADGIVMLDTIRQGDARPDEPWARLEPALPELARFGEASSAVQAEFARATVAVSGGASAPAGTA